MRITIQPYNKEWPSEFESEADLLRGRLPSSCLIEHIGSTAVPGLAAKPIIDILIGIPSTDQLENYPPRILEEDSYIYVSYWESEMPFRRFFIKKNSNWDRPAEFKSEIQDESVLKVPVESRKCHIHLVHADHPFFKEHLRFRDILRSDEKVLREYQLLKEGLAQRQWESSADYAGAKSDFIRSILDEKA